MAEGGGIWSVCGWASVGRQGDLWLWLCVGIYWLGLHTYAHTYSCEKAHINLLDPDTLLFL